MSVIFANRNDWRRFKDRMVRYGIGLGGVSALVAILLIFFYLLWVVIPLFKGTYVESKNQFTPQQVEQVDSLLLPMTLDEYGGVLLLASPEGQLHFISTDDGITRNSYQLHLSTGEQIKDFVRVSGDVARWLLVSNQGHFLLLEPKYHFSFVNEQKLITPAFEFPLGEEFIAIPEFDGELHSAAASMQSEFLNIAAQQLDGTLLMAQYAVTESMLGDGLQLELEQNALLDFDEVSQHLLLAYDKDIVYLSNADGHLKPFELVDDELQALTEVKLLEQGQQLSSVSWLLGGVSLMVGTDDGKITQWFYVKDENNQANLQKIRQFDLADSAIVAIYSEHQRKGFYAVDADGHVGLFHTTAQRELLIQKFTQDKVAALALNARGDHLLLRSQSGTFHNFHVENEHPDISFASLWQKVWYEDYSEPAYVWQSSSSSTDHEPKMSLMPLAFGTLKAAFYAMIFAVPLAICGAIYTAYFMPAKLRSSVKPVIEIMEALPTVIIGFLAGLWLAPMAAENLAGVLSVIVLLPVAVLLYGWFWHVLPATGIKNTQGIHAILLLPFIIVFGWLAFEAGAIWDVWFFTDEQAGYYNMVQWLGYDDPATAVNESIDFRKNNSLIVGMAMGFAVIPTIFSIAEDAIFSVPKHLINGSLALGATTWQTVMRVVLPTASPGIFSAVMIGLGRAVGETMIVLMATGNTPIMDANIFEGMRTLAANIAVELPEAELGSTHYRTLFLTAFVLFVFTFIFNTFAESIRHRLRSKYGSL